ncbi:MAG TPA: T9SS type A sorting domain-containing protein, partial [Segetibacter sp.]|nr:T9SS type A sorting domain-containing protein [Segetibacter sp.]
YPQPSDLRALQVYNIAGQKLLEIDVEAGQENNYYQFNLSKYAPGTYVVRAVFTDRVVTTKILKF